MDAYSSRYLDHAVAAFVEDTGEVSGIAALGDGNINDTFLISFKNRSSLVLQRLNSSVFPDPQRVAGNAARLSCHLNAEISAGSMLDSAVYRFPETVQSVDGADWYQDGIQDIWRCQTFIDNSISLQNVTNDDQPFEAGRLLGYFHRIFASFDHRILQTPLPGFHDLKRYRQAYIEAVRIHRRTVSSDLEYCRTMVELRLDNKTVNELAVVEGIENNVIHGDPKCDNFLFDAGSNRAVSLIDLDTTAPGLTAVDIGDCLRSFCNPGGEKTRSAVSFNIDICRKLIDGYQSAVVMTPAECSLIYHGARLMIYELGLRFFTDYLENDRYFKVTDEEENLRRAIVQFRLLESLEAQRRTVESIAGC